MKMENAQSIIKHPELWIADPDVELPSKHHMMARLEALGFTPTEICRKLEVAHSSYYAVSKSPLYKLVVKRLQKELDNATTKALNVLVEAAPKAAEQMVKIMEKGETQRVSLEAATKILTGTGSIKDSDKGTKVTNINISDSKIALIVATLKELK